MAKQLFLNLPITDLNASVAFYSAVGFQFNPQFFNERGACMVVSDSISVMLLTRPFFQSFTTRQVADAHATAQVFLCLSAESRAEVDEVVDRALAAGGRQPEALQQDPDFMYGRNFEDPDGHIWEVMYMDLERAAQQLTPAETSAE